MAKIEIPCSYQGGKSRLAKDIVDIFFKQNDIDENTMFYDLCCGSGAITIELINRGVKPKQIIMLDKSSWGKFWNSIGKGIFNLTKFEKYINRIPQEKDLIKDYMLNLSKQNASIDEEYVYLLLQASSFGSKQIWKENNVWCNTSFRSYWQPTETSSRRSPVNPMMPMPDTLLQRVRHVKEKCFGLTCFNSDIYDILNFNIEDENAIIYIDPPYKTTTKYGFVFDINDFVEKLNRKTSISIYLSEGYKFSDNAICLSSGRSKGGISGSRNKKANEEWLNIFNKLN